MKPRKKKIAVFHQFMDNIGGAELVTLLLARGFKADIYTTNIDFEKIIKIGFSDVCKRIYSIGKVPVNAPYRQQLALRKLRKLNLGKKYDFYIISGDWAFSAAVNHKPNLWYIHSLIKEIWDKHEYVRKNIVPWHSKLQFDLWVFYNRHLNRKYLKHVDKIACNSENMARKIKKYLSREARVIYPPTEISKFKYKKPRNYWLSVNILLPPKKVEIQIQAFKKLPKEKLIIVGSYEKATHFQKYVKYIRKIKPENVEILSWISQEKLIDLYSRCKGFITTSQDEDFGLTVVEAMASGKPVIAPNEGGYKETMINNVTGKLIDNINSDKLIEAIKQIKKQIDKKPEKYKKACLKQAMKFSSRNFMKKIKKYIAE